MSRRRLTTKPDSPGLTVDRRQALKGLGMFAFAAPVIVSCAEKAVTDPTGTGGANGAGGTGTGGLGTGGRGTGGVGTGGTGTGGTSTGGVVGTGGTGTGGVVGTGGAAGKGAGGVVGAAGNGAAGTGATAAGGQGGGAPANPMFDNVATCTLTPTDPAGEGPFFIHDDEVMNDESLFRTDMRDGTPGVEFDINLRVLDSDKGCNSPISGVQVYVWHTNATGFYSGFDGQNPDMAYTGAAERTPDNDNLDRFCRGVQVTDANGIVSFKSIFPGWYDGRAIHVHFVALRPGSGPSTMSYRSAQYMVFTTQFYFDESFSRMIHENNLPYSTRATGPNYNKYVVPEQNVRPTMKMVGNVAVGALNIITASSGSRR